MLEAVLSDIKAQNEFFLIDLSLPGNQMMSVGCHGNWF